MTKSEALQRYKAMMLASKRCEELLSKRSKSIENRIRRLESTPIDNVVQQDPIPTACQLAIEELLLAIITKELACGPDV